MNIVFPDLLTVQCTRHDAVLHITLNRPETRNAMSMLMVEELLHILSGVEMDSGIRILVLRGAQGHFCAGGDIRDMKLANTDTAALAEQNANFGQLCLAFSNSAKAVVAVLEGSVMGGGLGLACVADVVLAHQSAVFRLPETGLGLIPAQITPFLLERLGYSQARRLIVTGASVKADEALALGLVHSLHPDHTELQQVLQHTLKQILQCAPQALADSKALLRRALRESSQDLIPVAATMFAEAASSSEGLEGMQAFLQKRKPHWSAHV
jgi:isohexenylglutaconyl-CoA hydratase